MKYIFLSGMILCSMKLFCQPVLDGQKKIDLSSQKAFSSTLPPAIAGIRIIHACPDSLGLGYIPADKGNETFKLVPGNEDGQWLHTFISQRYSGSFVATGKHLLWVIKALSLTTDSAGRIFFTNLAADVYQVKPPVLLKLFSTDTVFTGSVAGSDTYASAIVAAFDNLYASSGNVVSRKRANLSMAKEWTEDSIVTLASRERTLPVVSDPKVAKGVYATFREFSANAPSITEPVWATPDEAGGRGTVKLFMLDKDSTVHQLTSVWGLSFGDNELYKYENGRLLPIEKSGDGFILSRYQDPAKRKNQAFYWRRIAANGWPDDTNPYSRAQTLTSRPGYGDKNNASNLLPVATRIDMSTGELKF